MMPVLLVLGFAAQSARADFDAGMAAAKRKDFASAMKEWMPLAERGDARAQTMVGELYAFGKGVPQDDRKAADWFLRAAEQGHAEAQFDLGKMNSLGRGMAKNDVQAANWYRRGAVQGDRRSQSMLATAYLLGRGVAQDDVEAAKWARLAATQGDASSQRTLGWLYVIGRGVPQDEDEGGKWLRRAADQGDAPAIRALAQLPISRIVTEAADKANASVPVQDASSLDQAAAMMKSALHEADFLQSECLRRRPGLQAEIDRDLARWKETESRAMARADALWSAQEATLPYPGAIWDIEERGLRAHLDDTEKNLGSSGVNAWCRKYFFDLSEGIWRRRTPKVYTLLDGNPQ